MKVGDAVEIAYEWWPPRHGYIDLFIGDKVSVRVNEDDEGCSVWAKTADLKPFVGELEIYHGKAGEDLGEHGSYFRPKR